MISQALQLRIHQGDKEAFKTLYEAKAKEIYMTVLKALDSEEQARAAVKSIFLQIKRELTDATGPMDVDARLVQLTENQIHSLGQAVQGEPVGYAEAAAAVTWAAIAREEGEATAEAPLSAETHAEPAPAVSPEQTVPPTAAAEEPTPAESPAATAAPGQDLPPFQRTQAYMQSDPGYEKNGEYFPAKPGGKRKTSLGTVVLKVLILFFLVFFLWVLAGILMDLRVLPAVDLGFAWFNRNIFALFNV